MNIPHSQPKPRVTKTTDPIALLDKAANEAEQDRPTSLNHRLLSEHVSDLTSAAQFELLSRQGQPSQVRQIRESGHNVVTERAVKLEGKRKRPLSEANKNQDCMKHN
ncbi:MAG: hypothetical protein LW629_09415 [Burkholderiales bacterium]|jgi:hypothetical protein|nr:hypothetical protein [Burkholderiales bacterium]